MKLLSDEYREQISKMEDWGGNGWKWADAVGMLIDKYGLKTALDYGCGQGTLKKKVIEEYYPNDWYQEYDPARGDELPMHPVDLVTCTDVLEHIEPDYLDKVIAHLFLLTKKACFLVISLKSCDRVLPNGEGAHLIIEDAGWWMERIKGPMLNHGFNSMERIFSSRLDNDKQLILVLRKVGEAEALDKT